jgi:2'-5' RNA ligase
MVALYPSAEEQNRWALAGGEDPSEIHLTLSFHGKAAELLNPEVFLQRVGMWAARTTPFFGEVSGVGLFTAGETPVTYLSADLPSLPAAREDLIRSLASAGMGPSMQHGYTPHITLAYADRLRDVNVRGGTPLHFTHATVALGNERVDIPLLGVLPMLKAADSPLKAATHKEGLESDPGPNDNWVERTPQGRLPAYVEHVALAIHRRGIDKSAAIGMAIGRIKRWAAGEGNVDAGTRAAAAKAVAEWEALKAASGVHKAKLSAADRKNLKDSDFAIPESRSYPIHDASHARAALSRVAQFGSDDEKRRVRAAVKRRYPDVVQKATDLLPTSPNDRAALRAKTPKAEGVSLKRDKRGYFVHTHRARSKSFPTASAIPKSVIEFIESTG